QLQLYQQGLERQRADIALLGQLAKHQLPLAARAGCAQIVEHGPNTGEFRGIAIDEVLQHAEAVATGQHQAVRGLAVAPGTADFLAVVLHRLGQIEVHHVADVTLVDAHAEGDGGDDALQLADHETTLDGLAHLMGHAGVIGADGHALPLQTLGDLLGGLLLGDIDDARLPAPRRQPLLQALQPGATRYRLDQQVEVGPVEAGGDHVRLGDGEFLAHVGDYPGRRRGGQQQHLADTELALVVRQLQVIRAKVVAPLGDAVRLVDHQQGNRYLGDEVAKALVLQALHRDHQNLQLTTARAVHYLGGLLAALRRVDAGRGYTMGMQKGQLILHQRQQRRDHQSQVRQVQGRQLVAQRLARAGGKDRRRRATGEYGADHRLLAGPQAIETEDTFEGGHALSL